MAALPKSTARTRASLVALAEVVLVGSFATATVGANNTLIEARVKAGHWRGIPWEFRAGAWRDGTYCVAMLISRREDARGCGNVRREGGVSYVASRGDPEPAYVMGPVVRAARFVRVTFFDRPPLRLSTLPAPRSLQSGMRFFVALLPCPATPRTLVAQNAAGRTLARSGVVHRLGPRVHC